MAGKADITAGKAFVELGVKNSAFLKGMDAAGQKLKAFGTGLATAGAAVTAAGVAIKGLLTAAVLKFADSGSELLHMSERIGIAVESLSALGYAAEQSGSDMEGLESGVKKMQKSIGAAEEGNQAAVETFARLGISISDIASLSPDQQFEAIADSVSKIADPTQKAAIAMQVFGKNGTALLPMLDQGKAGIEDFRKEAEELGIVMSTENAEAAGHLHNSFLKLERVTGGVVKAIGAALAPTIEDLVAKYTKIAAAVSQFISTHKGLVVLVSGLATGLIAAGVALTGLGAAASAIGAGLSVIAGIIGTILSPITLLVAGIGGLTYAFFKFTTAGQNAAATIGGVFGDIKETAVTAFGGIKDALSAGDFALAGSIAITALQVAMLTGITALSGAIGGEVGDMLGTIGTQISQGDWSGAWNTAVKGMAKIWADFSNGVVGVFVAAARGVVTAWQAATSWIANRILELDNLMGGTMAKEQARRDTLNAQLKKTTEANLAHREELLQNPEQMAAEGWDREQLLREIENDKKTIARLSSPESVLAEAQKSASAQIGGMADTARGWLGELDKTAMENAAHAGEVFHNAIKGGSSAAQDALDQAKQDLATLRQQAAEEAQRQRDKDKDKGKGKPPPGAEDLAAAKTDTFVTFSAAAAAAVGAGGGAGGSPAQQTAKNTAKLVQQMDKMHDSQAQMAAAVERLNMT
jgi:hypothetical protein